MSGTDDLGKNEVHPSAHPARANTTLHSAALDLETTSGVPEIGVTMAEEDVAEAMEQHGLGMGHDMHGVILGADGTDGNEGMDGVDGALDFDPDTLANLAALSNMPEEEGDDETIAGDLAELASLARMGDAEDEEAQAQALMAESETLAAAAAAVSASESAAGSASPSAAGAPDEPSSSKTAPTGKRGPGRPKAPLPRSKLGKSAPLVEARTIPLLDASLGLQVMEDSEAGDLDEEADSGARSDDDVGYNEPKYVYEDGRLKRKRKRTVLSCTECHRRKQQCDRKVPCNRCIQRGLPGMCKMEIPQRKKQGKYKTLAQRAIEMEHSLRTHKLEDLYQPTSPAQPDIVSAAAIRAIAEAVRSTGGDTAKVHSVTKAILLRAKDEMSGGARLFSDRNETLQEILAQFNASNPRVLKRQSMAPTMDDGHGEGADPWSSAPVPRWPNLATLFAAFNADQSPSKVNLMGPGFREDNGTIFVPPTVRYVEKKMREQSLLSREALPVQGDEEFLDLGLRFAYGAETPAYKQGLIASIQTATIQSTLHLAAVFLSRFPTPTSTTKIFLPSPSSPDEDQVFRTVGLAAAPYRFLDRKTGELDWEGMKTDLLAAPKGAAIVLYIGGSMPTGVDLDSDQWDEVTHIFTERKLTPLAIMAFQGLQSADAQKDAQPLRQMVAAGLPVLLIQNFDNMMGLHADSPTILSVVTQHVDTKKRVDAQLRNMARPLFGLPRPWGSHIVRSIMSEEKLFNAWSNEIRSMAGRLKSVRERLCNMLSEKLKTPGIWSHIRTGSGMYCTTLLTPAQTDALARKHHLHLLPFACVSLGCLNAARIDILARAIDHVVRESIRETEEAEEQRLAIDHALKVAREAAAQEEAEQANAREMVEAQMAQEEDQLLMERSIQSAMEQQRMVFEEQERQEEEQKKLEEAVAKAAEKAELIRKAEAILATMGM